MNILVTGAGGQLGNEIRLAAAGAVDNYIFTDASELDVCRREEVMEFVACNAVDVIINCAAYTDVEKAEVEPDAADTLNHLAVAYLAEAASANNAFLIHISTDYVFGGTRQNIPFTEDAECVPTGVYGATKLAGEHAIAESGCRYMIFRTSWLYSLFGNNFLKTMLRLTAERESLDVVFDQTGTPTYAADLASLLCRVVQERRFDAEGVYHFSNEGVCSWYDFAVEIARLAGHNHCKISPCRSNVFPSRVRRPAYSVLDKSKVRRTFGVAVPHWCDSLSRCMEQLRHGGVGDVDFYCKFACANPANNAI